jgi:hypothetical protein
MAPRRPTVVRLRRLASLAAALATIAAGPSASGGADAHGDRARYAALVRAVRGNVGHAHGVRGMNACTIMALREAASDDDVDLLQKMLDDRDRVVALTALYVLPTMGDAGVAAVRARVSPTNRGDAESAIQDAARTRETIEGYRARGECKIRK